MARKRRGRAEGSIYQRADGMWACSVSLGYNAQGKRKRRTVYGKTKGEVQEKLLKLQTAAAKGRLPAKVEQVTLGAHLDAWLDLVKTSLQPTTWARYKAHVDLQLVPHLGRVKLAEVTDGHVEQLYRDLLREGVSPAMVRKVADVLQRALEPAVARGILPANPAKKVPRPRALKKEVEVYTPAEVNRLLAAATEDRLEAIYYLAIDSGARQGELFALRWTDYDPQAGSITITKSLAELKGKLWVKEVKTKKSRRKVVLRFSLPALDSHRAKMLAEGQNVKDGLMFPDNNGGFLRKSNFTRRSFAPLFQKAGLKKARFHDLRHWCASLLLAAGEDSKVVSERLGHSSAAFTATTYQHCMAGLQERAAGRLQAILDPQPAPAAAG